MTRALRPFLSHAISVDPNAEEIGNHVIPLAAVHPEHARQSTVSRLGEFD